MPIWKILDLLLQGFEQGILVLGSKFQRYILVKVCKY